MLQLQLARRFPDALPAGTTKGFCAKAIHTYIHVRTVLLTGIPFQNLRQGGSLAVGLVAEQRAKCQVQSRTNGRVISHGASIIENPPVTTRTSDPR